ncbi:MAG TPA: TetR/AcrR family transcriptional regulator [Candidatus Acidoferrales bacterium]|nr:TetR/AcrR family transcriptional regulator [Candidatus Acidoferrales bacterium]
MGIHERKEREKQMRRDLILKASEEVFFEKGLRATTLDEIAERAEVSKGTIYLYFASKEDLYFSLMTKGLSMLLKVFEDTDPDESDPQSALVHFGVAYQKFSDEQSYLFKMLAVVENPAVNEQVSPGVLSELERMSDKVLSYVSKFVQKGIDAGTFRTDLTPYEAVILFWVSLSGILNLKMRAAAMHDIEHINKDSVLHGVDYDLLYKKGMDFLMNFLVGHDSRNVVLNRVSKKTRRTLNPVKGDK